MDNNQIIAITRCDKGNVFNHDDGTYSAGKATVARRVT